MDSIQNGHDSTECTWFCRMITYFDGNHLSFHADHCSFQNHDQFWNNHHFSNYQWFLGMFGIPDWSFISRKYASIFQDHWKKEWAQFALNLKYWFYYQYFKFSACRSLTKSNSFRMDIIDSNRLHSEKWHPFDNDFVKWIIILKLTDSIESLAILM